MLGPPKFDVGDGKPQNARAGNPGLFCGKTAFPACACNADRCGSERIPRLNTGVVYQMNQTVIAFYTAQVEVKIAEIVLGQVPQFHIPPDTGADRPGHNIPAIAVGRFADIQVNR